MNDIQIKSLYISGVLAVEYLVCLLIPGLFGIFFGLTMLTIVAALVYLFSFKKEIKDIIEKSRFFIIPLLFNAGGILFISIFSASFIKVIFSLIFLAANYYLFVALKRVQNLEDRAAIFQRNVLISMSFFALLLSLSSVFRAYVIFSTSKTFSLPISVVVIAVGLIYYFLLYFLSWENGLDMKKILPYNLVSSLLACEITMVGLIWVVNYPVFSSSERANLGGFPLPAIFLTIIFYFMWGIVSHKMDRSLTRRVMTEYIIICVLFITVLILTAKWLPII